MNIAIVLLCCAIVLAVTLFIVRRRIEIGQDNTAITTTLGLIRELVVPLLCGLFMLSVTVRGLLRGEVACSAKDGTAPPRPTCAQCTRDTTG